MPPDHRPRDRPVLPGRGAGALRIPGARALSASSASRTPRPSGCPSASVPSSS
jgi:hypothetical protein